MLSISEESQPHVSTSQTSSIALYFSASLDEDLNSLSRVPSPRRFRADWRRSADFISISWSIENLQISAIRKYHVLLESFDLESFYETIIFFWIYDRPVIIPNANGPGADPYISRLSDTEKEKHLAVFSV